MAKHYRIDMTLSKSFFLTFFRILEEITTPPNYYNLFHPFCLGLTLTTKANRKNVAGSGNIKGLFFVDWK